MKIIQSLSAVISISVCATTALGDTSAFEGLYKPRGDEFASWDCESIGQDRGAFSIVSDRITMTEESCALANPTETSGDTSVSFDAYCAIEGTEYDMSITLLKTDFGVVLSGEGFSVEWERCETAEEAERLAVEPAEQEQFRQAVTAMDAGEITRAIKLFVPLADAGIAAAQFNIGLIYRDKSYGRPDLEKALYWFGLAAEQGVSDAQFYLGEFNHRGQVVNKNFELAMEWYLKAAKQGNGKAQANIGFMYVRGQGVGLDVDVARIWYQKSADNGSHIATAWLRDNLPISDEPGSIATVLEWEGPVRDLSTAQALDKGETAYSAGDYVTALKEFKPLAEAGDAQAQNSLGFMYDSGQGVPQDDAEAVKWYRLAAEQGLADAQYNLGSMYHYARGVPQDDAESMKWYRLAAEQGDAGAQHSLGFLYENDHLQQLKDTNRCTNCDLNGADLSGANLSGADLYKAKLYEANLSGANLSGANLSRANLFRANLSGANLGGANLSGASLDGADLSGEDLSGANLSGADLSGANLSGANLNGADLSGAYLSRADLSGANLNEANLSGAMLSEDNLSGAIFCDTTMPDYSVISSGC